MPGEAISLYSPIFRSHPWLKEKSMKKKQKKSFMCRLVSKIFIWLTETYGITKVGPAYISEEGILSTRGNLRIGAVMWGGY